MYQNSALKKEPTAFWGDGETNITIRKTQLLRIVMGKIHLKCHIFQENHQILHKIRSITNRTRSRHTDIRFFRIGNSSVSFLDTRIQEKSIFFPDTKTKRRIKSAVDTSVLCLTYYLEIFVKIP